MAVDVIEALQDTPEEYRGDSSFDELWQHSVDSVTLQRGGGGFRQSSREAARL